ncbi:hypothetical protein A3A79_01760 [Candidatus Gottesmanbacteria bacterium RIFCSPLOWO2_01_FULL_43_11b]|uniref:Uncharacterized protein n=1 Tax=Candidatus Gottesmanbacteria bacterium RIFCSPLOWO2_01_FULL_43_11b TaxID=1798392 RepID=A0A1F6AH29_9BACT|nr:MAG: hypothetical protein A3A79_01760 [Candidatus Gottesmanbacteria bacterium RIFCSPLOWO2_01_FULL_43_11b]
MIFIPSGSVVTDIQKGIDPKKTIELHGHEAGEFVVSSEVSLLEKILIKKAVKQKLEKKYE